MNKKSTILLVDDSATNIQVLASCLKDKYHLKIATNGQQCLSICANLPSPDLILLDIEMPDMNGYEVLEEIKKISNASTIPVIFVTGRQGNEDEEKGFRCCHSVGARRKGLLRDYHTLR